MTPLLRKRHRQIWTALAILLPLLFLLAVLVIPRPAVQDNIYSASPLNSSGQ